MAAILPRGRWVNRRSTELFQILWVDNIGDDALTSRVARSPANIILTVRDSRHTVFHMASVICDSEVFSWLNEHLEVT